MIGQVKLILIINNEGQAAALNFPAAFPYPETKTVVNPRTKEERVYHKTNKVKTVDGQPALIYTVSGFRLNIDDFADGDWEGEPTPDSGIEKSAGLRLKEVKDVLFDQIEYYKELKKSGEDVQNKLYERFEYLSKEDYVKLIEALV